MKEVQITSTAYQCEVCNVVHGDPNDALQCESEHLIELNKLEEEKV